MPLYGYSMRLRDAAGNETNRSWQIDATDFAEARTRADTFRAAYVGATKLDYVKDFLTESNENGSVAPESGSRVGTDAVITVGLATAGKKASLAVPVPVSAINPINTNTVNLTASELTDVVDLFKTASYMRLSDGEAVQATDPILRGALRSTSRRYRA